ncbi:MAG TPA: RNA 2',3'-cyclic phosphodiesterase [Ktedonobacterales bacterium]|nr:RNA 2',3'-cyclic phosphodiesterase [Ktedonobacterales bacterium]
MTRTFIAIELSDEARSHLSREVHRLAQALPRLRWVDPGTLHLTLAFLGELDDEQLDKAIQATTDTAAGAKLFALSIGSLGTFGPPRSPRVVWSGVTGDTPHLLSLQKRLSTRLAEQGFPPEERPYAPHLTLARIKDSLTPQELAALQRLIPPTLDTHTRQHTTARASDKDHHAAISVEHLSVMKSELLRDGPRYTCLRLCPLRPA